MNRILLSHLLLVALLFNCQIKKEDAPQPENPVDYFDQAESLALQKIQLDAILPQIMEMAITEDYLVILSNGVPYLYIFDKTNGELVTAYSATGKGPHEFLRPQKIEPLEDNHIQLYDMDGAKIYDVNIDHLISKDL